MNAGGDTGKKFLSLLIRLPLLDIMNVSICMSCLHHNHITLPRAAVSKEG
jgi:hypothetical protein